MLVSTDKPTTMARMDDALGDARRPAGVDNVERILGPGHKGRRAGAGRGHPLVDVFERHADQFGHEIRAELGGFGSNASPITPNVVNFILQMIHFTSHAICSNTRYSKGCGVAE